MNGCLLFATKYGSTERVSHWIAEGIRKHQTEVRRITQPVPPDVNFMILGSPIFIGKPMEDLYDFIENHKDELFKIPFFLFITSWAQSTRYSNACQEFLNMILNRISPSVPILTRSLSGKLILEELRNRDRKALKRLLHRVDARQPDFRSENIQWGDRRSQAECNLFGEDISRCLDALEQPDGECTNC